MTTPGAPSSQSSSSLLSSSEIPELILTVPFQTDREAEIAYNSLRVDREPKRSQVTKTLELCGNKLKINLSAKELRQIRLSSNTLFDHLTLVQKTIDKFSLKEEPVSSKLSKLS